MTTARDEKVASATNVTIGQVFSVWLPPALSGGILTTEIPVIAALVARSPQGTQSLAAFGVTLSLIVIINSPALSLASTTAALGHTQRDRHKLRQFTLLIGLGLGVLLSIGLLTPVHQWVLGLVMGLDEPLVLLVRQGMWPFVLAPIAVSWRRFQQGLLIYHKDTTPIVYATGGRIVASVVVAAVLLNLIAWPGVTIGTFALTVGAIVEALTLTVWNRWRKSYDVPAGQQELLFNRLLRFHTPLVLATLLPFLFGFIITSGITRAINAELSLAAWPVLFGLMSLLASPTVELESITVSFAPLRNGRRITLIFSVILGLFLSSLFLIVAITPLATLYFQNFSGLTAEVAALARRAGFFALIAPGLFALRSWLRGFAIAQHRVNLVQVAIWISFVPLLATLFVGLAIGGIEGAILGAMAYTLALTIETAVLWFLSRRAGEAVLDQEQPLVVES